MHASLCLSSCSFYTRRTAGTSRHAALPQLCPRPSLCSLHVLCAASPARRLRQGSRIRSHVARLLQWLVARHPSLPFAGRTVSLNLRMRQRPTKSSNTFSPFCSAVAADASLVSRRMHLVLARIGHAQSFPKHTEAHTTNNCRRTSNARTIASSISSLQPIS